MRPAVSHYELLQNWNCKDDSIFNVPGGTGNWAFQYSVGNRGTVSIDGSVKEHVPSLDGTTYLGMFWSTAAKNLSYAGGATARAAAFVNPQAGTGPSTVVYGTGAGGGDYHLTADPVADIFKNRVDAGLAVLRYDLDGVARLNDGTGACGCYERAA